MTQKQEEKTLINNKRALHEYFVSGTIEAGISLKGTEVKSLRKGKANFVDSYAEIKDNEVFLKNMHISEFEHGNIFNHEEKRTRKLLLNKNEIRKLRIKVSEKGFTLVPIRAYLKNGKIKIEIAIAKGKKFFDKRETLAKKDAQREIEIRMKKY